MDAVVSVADHAGAWILADEVYAGAERVAEGDYAIILGSLRQGAGDREHVKRLSVYQAYALAGWWLQLTQ